MEYDNLSNKVKSLQAKYEKHFNTNFPQNIIGWWNPVNIATYPDELKNGINQMEKDINNAINTNTPIKELSQSQWDGIIF